MSLEHVKSLFAYDNWAMDLLFDTVSHLPENELTRDRSTSHGSIFGTLVHIVGAVEVWLARWRRESGIRLPNPDDIPSVDSLRERWERTRRDREAFVSSLAEKALDDIMDVATSQGETYQHTYRQMFHHLVNHSSYHRGQVVTTLRQIGVEPPATDLIRYYRLNR